MEKDNKIEKMILFQRTGHEVKLDAPKEVSWEERERTKELERERESHRERERQKEEDYRAQQLATEERVQAILRDNVLKIRELEQEREALLVRLMCVCVFCVCVYSLHVCVCRCLSQCPSHPTVHP